MKADFEVLVYDIDVQAIKDAVQRIAGARKIKSIETRGIYESRGGVPCVVGTYEYDKKRGRLCRAPSINHRRFGRWTLK